MTPDARESYRLCLVTDHALAGGRPIADIAAAAVAGGVTMVQLREKTRPTRSVIAEARALRALLRPAGIPLIVDDRVDVALAVGADGVHVGQDDMPVDDVRRLVGPTLLVGLSITDERQMRAPDAAAADYLGVGPLFAQATKADAAPPLGLAGLDRLRRMSGKPILAIGGVAAGNAAAVIGAGADGVAVVSAIMAAPDPCAAARRLRDLVDAALASRLTHG